MLPLFNVQFKKLLEIEIIDNAFFKQNLKQIFQIKNIG